MCHCNREIGYICNLHKPRCANAPRCQGLAKPTDHLCGQCRVAVEWDKLKAKYGLEEER